MDFAGNLDNIETLDMTGRGGNDITALKAQDVIDMTGDDDALSILGDLDDSVDLFGGSWSAGGTDSDGDINYQLYTASVNSQEASLKILNSSNKCSTCGIQGT